MKRASYQPVIMLQSVLRQSAPKMVQNSHPSRWRQMSWCTLAMFHSPQSFRRCENSARMSTSSIPKKLSQINGADKMTICVEGNIGSGKTMLLDYFSSQTDNVQVLPEPVNMWRDVDGNNVFGLMYEDPTRWSFLFQSYVQLTMLRSHQAPHTRPLKMMERSIYSAKYCFVENHLRNNMMTKAEYAVLTEWFNWLLTRSYVNVDHIIYLKASPECCLQRLKERSRVEEKGITLDLLMQLDRLHEEWLIDKTAFSLPAPVMVAANNFSGTPCTAGRNSVSSALQCNNLKLLAN
ncbi:thymidine kinase 2, mitochondrial-like isoform X3 [Diadema setosum]|uniref:thymidine kinase 2, mitochondrial-like isoform X3 n=1 Tax=Diadema setosum TaxID=31175 RepID=UPI003B3B9BC0